MRSRLPVGQLRNVYSSTNVTTSTWVALGSALTADVSALEIFDSSGSLMEIGYGPDTSHVTVLVYIPPGGNTERVPAVLSKGMSLFIKAVDVSATTGQIAINLYQ